MSSSGTRSKHTRLLRQASVLHELQESQERNSLEIRYARLMAELAALCSDRSNVITAESLQFFATTGRAEPVKLERAPERTDTQQKQTSSKQDDLLSADAARRQRVEELTRFFMEAKSDIEFALGGGRDFHEAKDKEKDVESERDEDKEDADAEDDIQDDTEDPIKRLARLHSRLLKDKVDTRVYNVMLGSIREQDPALYGAILCHPLVSGVDPKKDKKKKKKRKDRDRKEKQSSQSNIGAGMLTPDLTAEPLTDEEMKINICRFVARSIADGSLQALMLAVKLVMSFMDQQNKSNKAAPPTFQIASHLRVLRGEKAPEYKMKQTDSTATFGKKKVMTPTKLDQTMTEASALEGGEENVGTELKSDVLENTSSAEMDLDSESGSIVKLRVQMSQFDNDGQDADADDDDAEERGEGDDKFRDEGVDEDALMARAIALSLSPEDQNASIDAPATPKSETDSDGASQNQNSHSAEINFPARFSAKELLQLGPFKVPTEPFNDIDGVAVVMTLIAQMTDVCMEYLKSCQLGILPNKSPVQPHPLTFMLLNSLLKDLHNSVVSYSGWSAEPIWTAKWSLFSSCSVLSLFRVLEVNLFHVELMGIAPASVGLGQISKPSVSQNDDIGEGGNPLLESLKSLVLDCITAEIPSQCEVDNDIIRTIILASPDSCSPNDVQNAAAYYSSRIREQAMAVWIRAFAIFYVSQTERHSILASNLIECLKLAREGKQNVEWKFYQLDLLCARLALPDMVQQFVPACVDAIEHDGKAEHIQKSDSGKESILKLIDDGVLINAASRTGGIKAKWDPAIVRASLDAGSLSLRCLYDYIFGHGSSGLLNADSESSGGGLSDNALNADALANAYDDLWYLGRRQKAEELECINRLPSLVDLLRESVLSEGWHNFSFEDSYDLTHAPLLPLLEKVDNSRLQALNCRIVLLRSLQDLMIQRLGGSRGDELPALEFDPSRCAETMTLSDGNRTAKQYTAKQWGMVIATTGCPPNTGIHEWGVRLDRCEKGHIFLGVCTRDASVATYVGGDRQGWGLIGTRALWHARSKVRGDYGDGFTTGSVVRVRLNTDSGALSFGVGDSDWGIAFDGLTQHGTLYPAIGLYQRDDQVTILPVQPLAGTTFGSSRGSSTIKLTKLAIPAVLKPFLHHAGTLLESCCSFLSSPVLNDLNIALGQQLSLTSSQKAQYAQKYEMLLTSHPLLFNMIIPLVSSLSLVKDYHGLCSILAITLVPWCIRTVQCIEHVNQALRALKESNDDTSFGNLVLSVAGEWELKSMAAGNIPAQQYHLTLSQGKDGSMQGRSSGSFTSVTLNGIARGTKVSFIETWRQGGTCLVEGRLRADGTVFTGSYEDTKSHTSGCIVGNKILPESKDTNGSQMVSNSLVILEMVISNLLGYFSHALISLENDDLLAKNMGASALSANETVEREIDEGDDADLSRFLSSECSHNEYDEWVNSSLLEGGLPRNNVQTHLMNALDRCADISGLGPAAVDRLLPVLSKATEKWKRFVLPMTFFDSVSSVDNMGAQVNSFFLREFIENRGEVVSLDRWVLKHVGESPFVRLGGEPMKVTRRTVCAAMIWHSGSLEFVKKCIDNAQSLFAEGDVRPHDNLMHIWRAAQRVIEWAIRAKKSMGSSYTVVAELVIQKAQFLLQVEPSAKALAAAEAVFALTTGDMGVPKIKAKAAVYECAERIYSDTLVQVARFVEAPIRIAVLQSKMLENCSAAFFRTIGMLSFRYFVGDSSNTHRGVLSPERHEIIRSSFALSSALQWLSPIMADPKTNCGRAAPLDKEFGDFSSILTASAQTNSMDLSYYLSGLGGCGKHLRNDLRTSFESLYGYLSATLSKATWAHDTDLQLVILLAWGIIIQPDDHSFLSRVGIFRVLQTVLDEARGSSDANLTETSGSLPLDSINDSVFNAENKKKIVQAALKVVHLLAAQVAHVSDTDGLISSSDLPSSSGLSLGSIPLLRKPSGPETLGKSVFHMLYTELKNSLEDMRRNREKLTFEATSTAFVTDPTQSSDSGLSKESVASGISMDDAQEYCYQICSLLYSVSGSPVCRSHLSSSRWLRLLLALVDVDSPQIQRRILKLLRRLLPSLDPTSLKVRYDELESFDMDSDDELDGEVQGEQDHASTLISFFVGIVGLISPPSVAKVMLHRLASVGTSKCVDATRPEENFGFFGGVLAAEVVLLLRSLYESDKWADYLNRAISEALASVPLLCVTEHDTEGANTADSDIEMEDVSREIPSLESWSAQIKNYERALSALCILDGHIEGLHVGGTVKIMPRAGSTLQEIAFRGARGVIVAYEPEKSAAEVLLRENRTDETSSQQFNLPTRSVTTRPIRVPIDDLFVVPEVELSADVFSDEVLRSLLVERFPYFMVEVEKSLKEVSIVDALSGDDEGGGNDGDSEDDDDMSNDGSSSPSAMDSEMPSGAGADESDSEVNISPCHQNGGTESTCASEPTDILAEMEKESRLYRMLLCQHGLRASATLLRNENCATIFIRGVGPKGLKDLLAVAVSEMPTTAGVGDISSLEESWLMLWSRWYAIRSAHAAPSPLSHVRRGSNKTSDILDTSNSSGAIVQQMMEMGFPKEWCDVALARCSQNVEAAINFCFEHSSDMERLVTEYRSSRSSGDGSSKFSRKDDFEAISPLLEQLSEMGFPFNWCKKALAANRNNVDAALTWILSNGEALETEDRRDEEIKLRGSGEDDTEGNAPRTSTTALEGENHELMPNPLRAVSGQACIGEHDLMVEGLVGGGFASVGAPDCLVSNGRWYYEAILHTNGCIQIGWADVAFCGAADRGDGVGDGAHSWAYDGWRQQRWHGRSSHWGSKWKQGDVIGCGIDADAGTIIFSLNGKMRSANMGVAFRAIEFARGVYPCASFNRRERLQFNLGGIPFKYSPPPGFKPILNVLSNTSDLGSVPKGFNVIGSREDCLEESMGDEYYSSDTRYFARDMHPSMLRTSGHTRNSNFALGSGMTKSDALAEIKALPDNRVYVELLVITRSLAILQARRALLTLLAKWPTSSVGSFSVARCLSGDNLHNVDSEKMDMAKFVDFVKLIASLSAIHTSNALPGTSQMQPDSDALHLLNCGATGRFALSLLSGVVQSALNNALSSMASRIEENHPVVDSITSRIYWEVKKASNRQYARVPWNSSEAAITTVLLQITAEAGQAWSDKEVLNHPNLYLAEWLSTLLLKSLEAHKNLLSSPLHDQIRQLMLQAWVSALKSPSICVKERGATILGGMLQDILPKSCGITEPHDVQGIDAETKIRLKKALDALPLRRLINLSKERILREYSNAPVCSKYVQSLVELVSAAGLVLSAVGQSTDKLFKSSMSLRLQACKQIEVDLRPIDEKEYEEFEAAKKLQQVRKAQQAAEEAVKLKNLLAAQAETAEADILDRVSSSSMGQVDATGNDIDQDVQNGTNVAQNGAVTNMDVDNSDTEEAPAITLSAIANMANEDSDAMVSPAAVPPASEDRLDIKGLRRRTNLPVPELVQDNADTKFEFRPPLEYPVLDDSMLDPHEVDVLEAAKRGIMGDEPRGWKHGNSVGVLADAHTQLWSGSLTQFRLRQKPEETSQTELKVGCKVIRGPNWKWRDQDGGEGSVGVVEGVSPWSGVDGEGMSVRWPNDSLFTYRWGADGNYDLIHVEVDKDGNVTHQYPTQVAKLEDEGSFGSELHLGVLLYLFVDSNDSSHKLTGVIEWPDYGAAARVVGIRYADGSFCIQELQLTRGDPDMGWKLRFGTEKWQPGTKYTLFPVSTQDVDATSTNASSTVDTLRGEYTHTGIKDGEVVEIRGKLQVSTKYLFTMDHHNHFSTLGISSDGLTVTCHSGESRNLALGTVGFTTGVHYWEVHVDQAEFGSVFIGVCEKAGPPGSQAALSSRLNRWHGWGFVNFRATYHNSTERIYGDHFNASDTIGVRLDMEQGKLSFFMDGIKFGEHIVSDLGIAFENIKGEQISRTLYPCIGMRKGGDRVTLNQKWVSMPGVPPSQILSDAVDVSKSLHSWYVSVQQEKGSLKAEPLAGGPSPPSTDGIEGMMFSTPTSVSTRVKLPDTLLRESWSEWKRWRENHWQRCNVRPRGISVDFDTSTAACIRVSNIAGLSAPFLAGDRVRMCSKCGQELNQPEEAVVLGVYRGFLWYRTETQGNEGADEGRAWAWYWSSNELPELLLIRRADKDMTLMENSATDMSYHENSSEFSPFKPRSALEERAITNFDAFVELATQAHSTSSDMQLVERLNAHCAAAGLDVTNLKITDVVTPAETKTNMDDTFAVRGRSRATSLVNDDYFTSPALKNITGPELRARTAVLRVLNNKILRVLPFIAIQPNDGSSTQPIEVARSKTNSSTEFLSTSLKLRSLRRLLFTSTKRAFWDDVLRATTTSTPLPSDEYEDPREIRVIRINRIQAQPAKLSLLSQPGDRLRRSVFGQLYREMRAWNDSFFRRAYCGKGHGGQRRAFKVKFLGEGVNDYGGPYRAVFEQIVDELQMDNVELVKGEQGLLPLLIPCPNRRSATGINQDKFLLNPSSGTALLANGPMALDLHRFLGKLIGTAVRHGLQMGLDLPSLVWRPLAGLEVSRAHLESVDVAVVNNLNRIEALDTNMETAAQEAAELLGYLTMSTTLSDGVEVPLVPLGEKMPVTLANRELYVQLVEKTRLTESRQQLAALKDGLASVLPMELAPLFTPRELEVLICGRREVDVDLLHQCTEYSEGADEAMPHVQHFWEVLREMTSEERTSFLRFVWARSRMPNSAKDFPMNFKLQTAQDPGASSQPDLYLPHAQTCFFALRLPAYTSKEVLRTKLLYAIQNSPNMDADVRLHNAEGWADA
ncbi:hect e3 ubiquitin [Plasmopara halstedii]|uniref:Hect e3 ubiquitin n=1 Tax=Plasmopara halstedii TaxID=4781 RepID=A0A0P1A7D2_PLAHL|nr:hect e3 ubiquitin [Plasmopara halstedii]CEG36584.1 hect e3 ubiquitin [Plasmopara halstedii]|eukprot:XP_024572953.1 hect e3 ubiquitin [Plasmopara halstedii]